MTEVTLKPLSRKGKSRIAQFGAIWRVVTTGQPLCLNNQPSVFVESCDRRACRWVKEDGDEDFQIVYG